MNAKSWFDSMFQQLHTEICPSEFPVWSQGGLPYSFINDEKLMLVMLPAMHLTENITYVKGNNSTFFVLFTQFGFKMC